MNFFEAINAHVAWKVRLQRCVEGGNPEKLDPRRVAREDCCELGQWIRGETSPFHNLLIFKRMADEHRHFHHCAGEVVRLSQAGDQVAAKAMLDGEYTRLSHAVINTLTSMALELKQPGEDNQ